MILTTLVIVSLFIVNTRAAYYFVLALVSPRELAPDARATRPQPEAATGRAPAGYTVRVGPLVATVEPTSIEPARRRGASDDARTVDASGAAAPGLDAAPPPVAGRRAQRGAGAGSARRSAPSSGC